MESSELIPILNLWLMHGQPPLGKLRGSLDMNMITQHTGIERFFDRDELIVSKTDTKGHITYANHTFLEIAGYTESEVMGQPHNMIRHPNMPRAVFELLWRTIQERKEIFAYVVNS